MGRVGAILILGFIAAHTREMPEYLVIGFIMASVALGIGASPAFLASMKRRMERSREAAKR
jgi:hypothetical protein